MERSILAATRLFRFTMLLVMIALVAPVAARTKSGVTMPDHVRVGDKTLVLNGMGLREATFLKIDVYVAGLYVEHASANPAEIIEAREVKRIVLRFVHDASHDDIVKAWRDGFEHNATVPVAQLQPQIAQLDTWMPSFHDGDTLAFTYVPDHGVLVEINGARKGTIAGEDFARSLFAIWLGAKPPTDAVKRGLLGSK